MKIGLVGTGLMGAPLASRLLQGGFEATVYNRTPEKARPLADEGAEVVENPVSVVGPSDAIITMLSDAAAIREVLLTNEASRMLEGKTLINMATIAPKESREIAREVTRAGGEFMEAPVLGSIPQAQTGTLLLMVGATEAQFERFLPVLKCFGEQPRLIGPVGRGAALKLAMNQLIASLTSAFSLSLGLVQREGVPVETFMEILRESALYAPTFDKKLNRMLERDFGDPNFPVKHLLKDVRLFREVAAGDDLDDRFLEGIAHILESAEAGGDGDKDYSALFNAVVPRHD